MTAKTAIYAFFEEGDEVKNVSLRLHTFQFSAGETQVRIQNLEEIEGKEILFVKVKSQVYSSQDLVELALTLGAINNIREYKDFDVWLEIPYLPYSRQDRCCAPGEAFSLRTILGILAGSLEYGDSVETWDVHSEVAEKELDLRGINLINIEPERFLSDYVEGLVTAWDDVRKPPYAAGDQNVIVIAPDKGAVGRADEVRKKLQFSQTVFATKVRETDTGKILETVVPTDVDYSGKRLLIVDDICDGGRTFIELAKVLRKHNPESIDLYVTHGIFSKGFEVFEDLIDNFYVANLLPNRGFYETTPTNLHIITEQ